MARLLAQLGTLPAPKLRRVMLIINKPELDEGVVFADVALAAKLNLHIVRNSHPLGFGANHNQAFRTCVDLYGKHGARLFCVLNPDIELPSTGVANIDLVAALSDALAQPGVGLAYPKQVDSRGNAADFERALATPQAIVLRQLGLGEIKPGSGVDWVNGACMAFRADVFATLGGFDERYFMYCEDVDICLRLQLAGHMMTRVDASVVHHTHRRTLKNFQHLAWHLRSLLRLWRSDAYRSYVFYLANKQRQKGNSSLRKTQK